jgi:site-specific DNA-methyltransferase (adenine-specific)
MNDLIKKIEGKFPYELVKNQLMICGCCLAVMELIEDKSIDLVLTDPPYFNIVKSKWDRQWENMGDFQKWVGVVGEKFYRITKDNASFYWFGDDKNIAYCQVELDKQWSLLNNIVWKKQSYVGEMYWRTLRSFAPNGDERILFYDKGESKTGLEMVKEIMPNPFAEYLKSEFKKAKVSNREISELFPSKTGGLTGCVSNWLNGFNNITKEQYLKVRNYLNNEYLRKEYEELRKEYEELRKEYEELRRIWNNDKKAFDVLNFGICQDEGRFHPTQKSLQLISYLLARSSKKDSLVLDAFAGSFTTSIACMRTKRCSICIEKDKDYYRMGVERVKEEAKQDVFDF